MLTLKCFRKRGSIKCVLWKHDSIERPDNTTLFLPPVYCVDRPFVLTLSSFLNTGMKRPFSPSSLPNTELDRRGVGGGLGVQMDGELCCDAQDEGAVPDERSPGGAMPAALSRPKRERKQRSYTLCEVCNIQLNSSAQAQIHYNGKSHQKRLKQVSNGKTPSNTGRPGVTLYRPCVCLLLQNSI